jgi:hypothetical protein
MCEPACKWKIRNRINRAGRSRNTCNGYDRNNRARPRKTGIRVQWDRAGTIFIPSWMGKYNQPVWRTGRYYPAFLWPCDASDLQHVWKCENSISLNFTKKVKNRRKKTRNLLLSSFLVNFCRRPQNVDIASTKHEFFALWGREVWRETSRFLLDRYSSG